MVMAKLVNGLSKDCSHKMLSKVLNNRFICKIKSSDLYWRLLKGTFWSILGIGISRALMMLSWIVVARILGKESYGEFGIIRSTVNTFTAFASFGLGLTANKFVSEFKKRDKEKAGRIIGLSLTFAIITGGIAALAVFFFAPVLAGQMMNAPHLQAELSVAALMILFSAINGSQIGAMSGLESFKALAKVNIITGLMALPMLIIGAHFGGVSGTVIAFMLNIINISFWNQLALTKEARKQDIRPCYAVSVFKDWRILTAFSLPAAVSGFMVGPAKWICDAVIFRMPDGNGQMGLFAAALPIQMMVMFAGNTMNAPFLSVLSSQKGNSHDKFERVNILSSWLIGLVVALPLITFPELGEIVFGSNYAGREFRLTLSLVMVATVIIMYKQGLARVLAVHNLMWLGAVSNFIWASVLVVSVMFLRKYGAIGLGYSYVIAYALNTLVVIPVYVKRKLVPKGTLGSLCTFSIWGLVLLSFLSVCFEFNSFSKIMLLLFSLVVVTVSSFYIINPLKTCGDV